MADGSSAAGGAVPDVIASAGLPHIRSAASRASRKEGSTHLPPFPMVHIVKPQVSKQKKTLSYNEVEALRTEMRTRLFRIDRREKFFADYKRTQQDFWRMELDRLNRIGEVNRVHMVKTMKVYLGQSRGSNRAIQSLVKYVEAAPQTEAVAPVVTEAVPATR